MSSNDDMLVRKVEQQVKNENFPSANSCLLPSLDLISPIGKIRQREPGPITSTPRDIVLSSDEKEPSANLSLTNSISIISTSNEKTSPLELEKKKKDSRQIAVSKNLHEKRKIIWGNTGQIVNKSEITSLKSPLTDDKEPASPMQMSTAECISNMDISKRNSANNEAELLKEDKETNSCSSSDIFSTSDDSKIKGVQETLPPNVAINAQCTSSVEAEVVSDNNCSSFLVEKETIPTLKKSSNEIEDITAPNSSSEDSVYISTTDSSIEVLNNIEGSVLVTTNKLAATSIHDVPDSPSHCASTSEPAQKIPETLSRLELETQLQNLKSLKQSANLSKLPDCGRRLLEKIKLLEEKLINWDTFERDLLDNSLANVPENLKTNTPTSLLTELMPHQKEGLTWLLWRERQSLPGGILADDMGLGKTLSMISLIVNVKEKRRQNEEVEGSNKQVTKNSCLIPSRTTLIIAPASLIFQWEAEFQKHVKSGFLSRYVLARYDVVVTTYGIVSNELSEKFTAVGVEDERSSSDASGSHREKNGKGKIKRKVSRKPGSVLTKIAWERVILDEAHQIKNRTSLISKACCKIPAVARWCLTGTPIHNNLWDLYSLIRFLRVVPFDEEAVWKEYILSARSSQRLNTLVKGLLLRREKNQLCTETNKPIVDLKPRKYEEIVMKFEGMEKKVYDYMFQVSRQQVKELIKTREEKERDLYGIGCTNASYKPTKNPFSGGPRTTGNNNNFQAMTCVLTLLMRLRQACVHFALINQAVDMETLQMLGVEEDEDAEMLSKCFSNISLLDEKALTEKLLGDDGNKQIEQLFQKTFISTKIKKLFAQVDYALSCGDKCVIWTSLLNILEYHLERKKILYTSINGKVSSSDRQNRANNFNMMDSGPRVMLLSLTAGGVGLNLVGGNHLFLVDLHWNPALEQQACDRIYRIGQTKNVFIHKLVCLQTIEERVLALQRIKQTLARDVLDGVASKKLSKLTITDLKYLFDLGRPRNDLANFAGTVCSSKFIPV
uniref:SNF2 family domain-containing protein n=1 Tax=Wuchereria bancrofti TaxID=6293 RepID=A0A1I8EXZ6_WUCBA